MPVNPAGLAKHYLTPALAALGLEHVRWHDLRHAFAVMSLSAGEHYMAVSKMLGHASYVTTLTVYADYITEYDGGKSAPLGVRSRRPRRTWSRCVGRRRVSAWPSFSIVVSMRAMHVLAQFICRTELL